MLTSLFVFSASIFFGFISKYKNLKNSYFISFILLFFYLAFRYRFGNDYVAYEDMFNLIASLSSGLFDYQGFRVEPGWLFVNVLFSKLGFFLLIALWSLLCVTAYSILIYRYVPPRLYWFALCILLLNSNFLLTQLSMLRQSVSMLIFIIYIAKYSDSYIYKLLGFVVLILAYQFHKSSIVFFPILIANFYGFKIMRVGSILLLFLYFSLFFAGSSFMIYLSNYLSIFNDDYSYYMVDSISNVSNLMVLNTTISYVFLLYTMPKQQGVILYLYKIVLVGFLLFPLYKYLPMLTRIGFFFDIFSVVVYPIVFLSLNNRWLRYIFCINTLSILVYGFFAFFKHETWKDAYDTYRSIFEII